MRCFHFQFIRFSGAAHARIMRGAGNKFSVNEYRMNAADNGGGSAPPKIQLSPVFAIEVTGRFIWLLRCYKSLKTARVWGRFAQREANCALYWLHLNGVTDMPQNLNFGLRSTLLAASEI